MHVFERTDAVHFSTLPLRGHYACARKNTYDHTVSLLKEAIKWTYEIKVMKRVRPKKGLTLFIFINKMIAVTKNVIYS